MSLSEQINLHVDLSDAVQADYKPEKKEYTPAIKENNESSDESPYTIKEKDGVVYLTYNADKDDEMNFTIKKNIQGIREIAEQHQLPFTDNDVSSIVLNENEMSNDENINRLNKTLKSHGLILPSPEKIIELSLYLSNQ